MPISLQALTRPAPAAWASLISSIALRRERRWSAFRVLRAEGLPLFSQHQQSCGFRQRLLLAPQLLLQTFDLSLILGAELLQLLLLFHGQNRILIGILRGLPPTVHLLRVQTPVPGSRHSTLWH